MDTQSHWDGVYRSKDLNSLSWYEAAPERSVAWIKQTQSPPELPVIDVGAGASGLCQSLAEAGYTDITALDLSKNALAQAAKVYHQSATGQQFPNRIEWLATDLLAWHPSKAYALWHDRAVLHFLTESVQQQAYARTLTQAVSPGGHAIISVFAIDGPTRCSGISIQQYDPLMLDNLLGDLWKRLHSEIWHHQTPAGQQQKFLTAIFQRQNN